MMPRLARPLSFLALCAVFLTILFQWNLLSALIWDDYAYQPQLVIESDDEVYYLSLIREAARHPDEQGSPFIREGRSGQWTYPMGMVQLAGGVMRTMQWDIKTTAIVLDLVCPFFISFLVLLLFFRWFEGRPMGYVAGLVYLTLPSLFGSWQRPISPQLTFLPFLLTLLVYAMWRWKSYWRDIVLGMGGGVLFYTYPFHWTFILPLFVLDDGWTIWREKRFSTAQVIKYAVLLIVASMAIFSMIQVNHGEVYGETMRRIGLLHDRLPAGIPLQAKLAVVVLIFYITEKYLQRTSWRTLQISIPERQMLIGIAAGFLVLNQALGTGVQLESNAHYQPLILLFVVALFTRTLERLAERLTPFLKAVFHVLCGGVVVYLCVLGLSLHIQQNPFTYADPMNTPEAHNVYAWIRAQAPDASVVSAPPELFHGIPLFTNTYLQFSDLQWFFIGPTSDLLERFVYADPKNTVLTEEAAISQRMLLGFTYLAPLHKHASVIRFLKRLHIPTKEPVVIVPPEIIHVRAERESLTPEAWKAGLVRYGVTFVVLRKDRLDPLVLPGHTVFENEMYLVQAL